MPAGDWEASSRMRSSCAACSSGDSALFEVLMRRYNQRLYRVTRSIMRDDSQAEDVIQQAYVNAYLHLDQFAARATFSTWLTKIAIHEALARTRRRRCDAMDPSKMDGRISELRSTQPDPEHQAFAGELGRLLEDGGRGPARDLPGRLHASSDRRVEHGGNGGMSRDRRRYRQDPPAPRPRHPARRAVHTGGRGGPERLPVSRLTLRPHRRTSCSNGSAAAVA